MDITSLEFRLSVMELVSEPCWRVLQGVCPQEVKKKSSSQSAASPNYLISDITGPNAELKQHSLCTETPCKYGSKTAKFRSSPMEKDCAPKQMRQGSPESSPVISSMKQMPKYQWSISR